MDKSSELARETHDFMNAGSFSKLPFNSQKPTTLSSSASEANDKHGLIRLFGKELMGTRANNEATFDLVVSYNSNKKPEVKESNNIDHSNRRFECHYCYRKFPTSQALGGHQNAHKRERQSGKRVNLQSAILARNDSFPGSHHYHFGLMKHKLISRPSTYLFQNNAVTPNRFYGRSSSATAYHNALYSSKQTSTKENPLRLWKLGSCCSENNDATSSFSNGRGMSLSKSPIMPLFADQIRTSLVVGTGHDTANLIQHRWLAYESKKSVQDHVSLDLHL